MLDIPNLDCKKCGQCCNPIFMSEEEFERVDRQLDLHCPHLHDNKECTIYNYRPAICRLYGLLKEIPCKNGIFPSRFLSIEEADKFLQWFLDEENKIK
jgi:Fe-S-cluster containining protein